ncbi:LapA family protein [uncultured Ruminobacter sp.]|uniref:LapA family protein n=1 Tax=uncultured Ruminobacter sp. TaxID=538947 RepID=UPI0025FF98F0|nr:LapA family protein [uncultured Ruminobacter sp.]
MLDMLLIPLILPSIEVNDDTVLPPQVEMATHFQDKNPYKCIELINSYIDNSQQEIRVVVPEPKTQIPAVSANAAEDQADTVKKESATPTDQDDRKHNTDYGMTASEAESAVTPAKQAESQQPDHETVLTTETSNDENAVSENKEAPEQLEQIAEQEQAVNEDSSLENELALLTEKERKKENTSEPRQHFTDTENQELEKQRLQFFRKNPSPEKDSIFNVLTSCKIKVGQAKDTDFSSKVLYRKGNLSSIINIYNRIRSSLQNGTMNPIDINFIDTPSAINRENYLKIKPYIQLIELYKLSKSNNLKAVSFFETSVNDDAFSSYPDSIKNAFWLQGFNIYYELNQKNVAYYLLNQVEKNYIGKPQYMYNNAVLSKLLSELFLESDYPEFADEHLSKYVSVIELFPQEQLNYIDNLLQLSEIKIKIGRLNDAMTLLRKADNLISYTQMAPENEDKFRERLGHLYIKLGDYDRALMFLGSSKHDYSFNSENSESIVRLIDLAVALNGAGQTSNANQLMKTLSTYIDKIPPEYIPKYYHTKGIIEATQGNYAEAYKNLETAFTITSEVEKRIPPKNNHILPSPVFSPNYISHGSNIINIPVRMLIVMLSGFTVMFLIVSLALMRYYNKSRELEREIDRLEDDYPQSFGGDIKNYNDFLNFVIRQSMNYHQSEDDQGTKNIDLINNKDIYQIFIPGFTDLSIRRGYKQSQNQRNAFIDKLQNLIHIASDIYVINDSRYIIVTKPNADMDAFTMSNSIITKVEQVLKELHIEPVVNAGIISYPFINSAPYSLESNRIYELLSLALAGARTLSEHSQQSSFVRLTANRLDKTNLQDGDTYIRAINCIKKGCIKTVTLPEDSQVDWQQIQEDIML